MHKSLMIFRSRFRCTIAILLVICCLAILPIGGEVVSANDRRGEAFICDLASTARIELFRGGETAQMEGKELGMELYIDDRIALYEGWADICTLYSGKRSRLEPISAGSPPISFTVQRDAFPNPSSRLRELVIALFEILQPIPEAEPKELITKGSDKIDRGRVFPPAYCKAALDDRLAVAWDLDLVSPIMILRWKGDKMRYKDLVDSVGQSEGGKYVFPYDLKELLRKERTTLEAGELLEVEWTLEDYHTKTEASGTLEIRSDPRTDMPAEDIPKILGLGLQGVEHVAWLFYKNHCLAARTRMGNLQLEPNTQSQLLNKLRNKVGNYP
uniref:Uncharacterized protein n=1 Tax=Candidatus Kentrum sp. LPFa TaxID=2126335 RepID=A0A450VZ22_9GAMM|nr:MAG: hypothetical protein BECKLPF1236A_GA0070988_1003110 [Candidatus Kentron sp. LPFa]VFK28881.1 MAG: hypothetical protein BECKLPF1236C_GA0070990_1007510 [Candidatus Kentron sp. LPFa]